MFTPTLSPAFAEGNISWCISMDLTSPVFPDGINTILSFAFIVPDSILPTGTVPTPVIVYTSCTGNLNGLSVGMDGASRVSNISSNDFPLYHGILSDIVATLSPVHADRGTNGISAGLIPTVFRSFPTSALIALNFSSLNSTSSILFIAIINCFTPRVFIKKTCSLVCGITPSFVPITRIAASAWDAPVIMFLTKSR